jgi:hypothetical protein
MSKIALCEVNGLLSNLLSNLSGKNGDEWTEILRRTLRRQNPFSLPFKKWEPNFTISTYRHEDVLGEVEKRFGLDKDIREMFGDRLNAAEGHTIDVVVLSVQQLGFDDVVKLRHVYVRAEEFGLKVCWGGVPVWALLQQREVFKDKFVHFAMEPIDGEVLGVGKLNGKEAVGENYGDTLTLYPMKGTLDTTCAPHHLWAFELPRRK